MAKRIAKFFKVSIEQFEKAVGEKDLKEVLDKITLPVRATAGSAGYDFVTPFDVTLRPGESIVIPTGIRCKIKNDWVLQIYPRSGLGFKYRCQLANTVGIIDSDYFNSDNEGHIMVKFTNDSKDGKVLELKAGDRFCQGIFVEYGVTYEDDVISERNGGFGSTGSN